MVNAHAGSSRNEPVQVVHMSVGHDPRGLASDSPLTIVAELDPAPDWEELQWWTGQLGEHVTVRGWSATSTDGGNHNPDRGCRGSTRGGCTAAARRADEANAVYPERYVVWGREHDAQVAEDRKQQERCAADRQAILDRVMNEHRVD